MKSKASRRWFCVGLWATSIFRTDRGIRRLSGIAFIPLPGASQQAKAETPRTHWDISAAMRISTHAVVSAFACVFTGFADAARSGRPEFADKFMQLSLRDPQFVEYQFESINQGSNMRFVRNQLTSVRVNFEVLGSEQKDAVFSTSVQQGGGGADKAVDYAFSPKTYTEVQTDFLSKQQEYQKLKDEGEALKDQENNLIRRRESIILQREKLEVQAKGLVSQQNAILIRQSDSRKGNEEVDSIEIDRLKNQSASIDRKIEEIENKIQIQTQKIDLQTQKIDVHNVKLLSNKESTLSLEAWLLKNAKAGAENPEQFIKDIYEWRIKNHPSEAKSRYIPERDMLLKQLKEKNP